MKSKAEIFSLRETEAVRIALVLGIKVGRR